MDPLVVSLAADGSEGPLVARSVAHRAPGVLHRAVSVQVFDPERGWLLQRRAGTKAAFASCWSNTCCTHPRPGEDPGATVVRRVREELALDLVPADLVPAGTFTYRAVDARSGLVEHETDHVFVAVADTAGAVAAEDEIDDLARLPYQAALDLLGSAAGAPWAAEVLRRSQAALRRSG